MAGSFDKMIEGLIQIRVRQVKNKNMGGKKNES
jgi:hypothetical protein